MKNILTLILIAFSFSINAQNRDEIILLMNEYKENYGTKSYSHDFVDTKLNPAILKVEKLTCENNDTQLFDHFLEMILKTKGSADETPSNILGGIFICKPELVEKQLTEKYKDEYLIDILEFGFGNKTHKKKEEIKNYMELKKRLNRLIE